ncbi:MAG TPA: hypothetical protein VFQ88_07290 [Nevskiaceae bacterium]|nr:hypothetical protein [Nevskiaceae bacterium]
MNVVADTASTAEHASASVSILHALRRYMPEAERSVVTCALRGDEGLWFAQTLRGIRDLIAAMPYTYQTDGQGDAAVVHLHYFNGGGDWYITERDRGESTESVADPFAGEQLQAFGLACPFGDDGELGYISIQELIACGVELDLHWKPRSLGDVRKARAHRPA